MKLPFGKRRSFSVSAVEDQPVVNEASDILYTVPTAVSASTVKSCAKYPLLALPSVPEGMVLPKATAYAAVQLSVTMKPTSKTSVSRSGHTAIFVVVRPSFGFIFTGVEHITCEENPGSMFLISIGISNLLDVFVEVCHEVGGNLDAIESSQAIEVCST